MKEFIHCLKDPYFYLIKRGHNVSPNDIDGIIDKVVELFYAKCEFSSEKQMAEHVKTFMPSYKKVNFTDPRWR